MAYQALADSYTGVGEYEKAAAEIELGLKKFPESIQLESQAFWTSLAQGRIEDAKRLAERASTLGLGQKLTDDQRAAALFPSAIVRVLLRDENCEEAAREFIETNNAYATTFE